jgi:hypothetical protein
LGHEPEAGVKSYLGQVADGSRQDGRWSRLRHLARANYAHNYINWVRRRSNDLDYLTRAGAIEQRLLQPWHRQRVRTTSAQKFHDLDYNVERGVLPIEHVRNLRAELFAQPVYYDPYVASFEFRGRPHETQHPFLYMDPQALVMSPHFLHICANAELIAFCREVLGPAAALSWAWAWITNPGVENYQNQNWHRDSSEPLNFIRAFVPLNDIVGLEDGPTALIPGSSRIAEFREVRRFSDAELSALQAKLGAGMIQADAGDVYYVNTMAIHRGLAPRKRRAILSLLVSLSPSHRTPAIVRTKLRDLPEAVRDTVAANRRFFRFLID